MDQAAWLFPEFPALRTSRVASRKSGLADTERRDALARGAGLGWRASALPPGSHRRGLARRHRALFSLLVRAMDDREPQPNSGTKPADKRPLGLFHSH